MRLDLQLISMYQIPVYYMFATCRNMIDYYNNFVYEFITRMYSFSLLPLITKPTKVTDNTVSLSDHLQTTEKESNSKFIKETDLSL